MWGTAGKLDGAFAFHHAENAFEDKKSIPLSDKSIPSARTISLSLFNSTFSYADHGGNDLLPYFGQFICHDIAAAPDGDEFYNIAVDKCDPYFDKDCEGNKTLPFRRTVKMDDAGVHVSRNDASTWIDAGVVYGPSPEWNDLIREYKDGLLQVSKGPNGDLLPKNYNDGKMANVKADGSSFFAGDFRANVNLPMVCLHTLFHLEHNHRARHLKAKHPDWDDETLFHEARRWVIAVLQKITYYNYVPAIIGKPLEQYTTYDPHLSPRIDTIFMTAAFRYGHSATNDFVYLMDENWIPEARGHLELGSTIFNPSEVFKHGMDSILRGLVMQPESDVDVSAPSAIRNHHILVDLVAFDIQRGRDRGLPAFNSLRRSLGLAAYSTWAELNPNENVQEALKRVYGDIEKVDAYVGGLAERPILRGVLPPTFSRLAENYFTRLRRADRFHFENGHYSDVELEEIRSRTLSQMVLDHTNVSSINENLFHVIKLLEKESCNEIPSNADGSTPNGENFKGSTTVLDDVFMEWEIVDEMKIKISLSSPSVQQPGYIGIGLGSSKMSGADFLIATAKEDGTFDVIDGTFGGSEPVPDEEQNIVEGSVVGSYSEADGVKITFERLLVLNNGDDFDIPKGEPVSLIFAKNSDAFPSYHLSSRVSASIMLWGGSGSSGGGGGGVIQLPQDTSRISLMVHGVSMCLSWLVFMPIGVGIVRYRRGLKNSMEAHQTLSQTGAVGIIAFAATAIGAKGGFEFVTAHARIGMCIVIFLVFQIINGWVVRLLLPRTLRVNRLFVFKRFHKFSGFILLFLALVNCYLGLQNFVENDHPVMILFVLYICGMGMLCIGFELKKKYLSKNYQSNKRRSSLSNVPKITTDEFNKRVSQGQVLMVINGYVYNVRSFANRHPGGSQILMDYIGTDATAVFDALHKHSVEANRYMNRELLEAKIESYGSEEDDKSSVLRDCKCNTNVCRLHFRRFRIVAMYQIAGSEESKIMLFRIQVSGNQDTASPMETGSEISHTQISHAISAKLLGVSKKAKNSIAKSKSYRERSKSILGDDVLLDYKPVASKNKYKVAPASMSGKSTTPVETITKPGESGRRSTVVVDSIVLKDEFSRNEPRISSKSALKSSNTKKERKTSVDMKLDELGNFIPREETSEPGKNKTDIVIQDIETKQNPTNRKPIFPSTPTSRATVASVKQMLFGKKTTIAAEHEPLDPEDLNGLHFEFYGMCGVDPITRAYTPISYKQVGDDEYYDFAIKLYPKGKMSSYLRTLRPGRFVRLKGPHGEPIRNKNSPSGTWKNIVLIAGGTGITPMLSIAKHHLDKAENEKVVLLYQVKTSDEFILKDKFEALSQKHKYKFSAKYFHTKNAKMSSDKCTRINRDLIKRLSICRPSSPEAKTDVRFVVCGTSGFETHITKSILKIGYPNECVMRL